MNGTKGVFALIPVVGIALLGWVLVQGAFLSGEPRSFSAQALEAMEGRGVLLGTEDAPAQVILFSDYQCGACAALEMEVMDSLRVLADAGLASVRILHTPFQAHRRARPAARLHVCSVGTGAEWVVHQRLFETRFQWSNGPPPEPTFHEIARRSGLDSATVAECLAVDSDRVEAPGYLDSLGITGLPTVVVNGKVVRPTASSLLADVGRVAGDRADALEESEQAPGCRIIAPIAPEIRTRAEMLCRDAVTRIERELAMAASTPDLVIAEPDSAWNWPHVPDGQWVVRTVSLDSLPRFMDAGLLEHEVAHFVVLEWLQQHSESIELDRSVTGIYGSQLPDVLDEGLAILGEPPLVRSERRQILPGIDLAPLGETLGTEHPGPGEDVAVLKSRVLRAVLQARVVRTVLSPCVGECRRARPDEWIEVTRRWTTNPQGADSYQVDTTYWSEPPPDPEVDAVTRFYVVAEAVISFLEEEFANPEGLRDYILALLDPSLEGADAMNELERGLGLSKAVIESRWAEWVRVAKEAVTPPTPSSRW